MGNQELRWPQEEVLDEQRAGWLIANTGPHLGQG